MRRLKIEHLTTYEFGTQVQLGPHKLLLRPRDGHDIRIESSLLNITPACTVKWHRDIYGNSVGMAHFTEPAATLQIASEVSILHFDENPLDFMLAPEAIRYPFLYDSAEHIDLVPYQTPCYPFDGSGLSDWMTQFWKPGQNIETFSLLDQMNRAIPRGFEYAKRDAPGVQSPKETLSQRRGSCRDFATLFIEACRALGLGARFASGYVYSPELEAGGGSTHAWAEVYLPGAGWKGFDSTSGEMSGAAHIATAVSRHPADVPPVSGTFVGPAGLLPALSVGVRVSRL